MDGAEVNSPAGCFLQEIGAQCREGARCKLLGVSVAALEKPPQKH